MNLLKVRLPTDMAKALQVNRSTVYRVAARLRETGQRFSPFLASPLDRIATESSERSGIFTLS